MIRNAINKVVEGENLNENEAREAMDAIMSGSSTDAQIAALITALRLKGETVDEITGFAKSMRNKATKVKTIHPTVIDTCGTGGDRAFTFNISTTSAFVIAAAGIPVAKHGNRSVSSKSGSADVLEALGVNLNITPEQAGICIDEIGIGFLYAPALQGAMKYAIGPRKEIGIRTVFNILGPLTNPAEAQIQVLGVYDPGLTEIMAEVLTKLGTLRAFVVHGHGRLDEVSLAGPTKVSYINEGNLESYYLDPAEYGFQQAGLDALRGGDATFNANITKNVLAGERGPHRDVVLLNSALGLVAGLKAENIREGIEISERCIDSGAAMGKLESLVNLTQRMAKENLN